MLLLCVGRRSKKKALTLKEAIQYNNFMAASSVYNQQDDQQ